MSKDGFRVFGLKKWWTSLEEMSEYSFGNVKYEIDFETFKFWWKFDRWVGTHGTVPGWG